jgi:hypothetical protein
VEVGRGWVEMGMRFWGGTVGVSGSCGGSK